MATHSNILAWEVPWTEEPGRLQPMGLQELDMTQQLNNNNIYSKNPFHVNKQTLYSKKSGI